jgi:hypothetical protein
VTTRERREMVLNTLLVMVYSDLLFALGAWYAVSQIR